GEICHFNKNFKAYVTTEYFGSTVDDYTFSDSIGAYNGTYVEGYPYYKVEFYNNYAPGSIGQDFIDVGLHFINLSGSLSPEIYIEVFDDNDYMFYSEVLTTPLIIAPNASFNVASKIKINNYDPAY